VIAYVDTIPYKNRKMVVLSEIEEDSLYFDGYFIDRDSFYMYDIYCENIDTIPVEYKNKTIEFFVSYYDVDNSDDEEAEIYWNHTYGIAAIYNCAWSGLRIYCRYGLDNSERDSFYNMIKSIIWHENDYYHLGKPALLNLSLEEQLDIVENGID